jgi:hypothetical protein
VENRVGEEERRVERGGGGRFKESMRCRMPFDACC